MKTLGKFEIIEQIGKGAMGVVYKARDPFIGRLVALKTITTGLADDPALLERFYTEARSAGALQHPNIVTIYELGREGDTPFIAMAFLEGGSLDKVIESHPVLPLSQKLGYIVSVCRALEYAHKRGVVHRDIKPGNVMVTEDGNVNVVDFGIARLGDTGKTQTGMLIGTLAYMSPQLLKSERADAKSDIWAVGVMFYELLVYKRPFVGDNQGALMWNIMMQPTPSVTDVAPDTPPDVAAVVDKMLRKEVEGRYQSMEEVLLELEPVWKRLQQIEVTSLVEDSKQLFEARDLGRAQDRAKQALLIDTANTRAKQILEKISIEIKRNQLIPQVKERVKKGQELLAAGAFEEAKAEAEAALRLIGTYQEASDLVAQVQVAAEKDRKLKLAIRTTKQQLAEGAFTEAHLQLSKVLELDPSNLDALGLLKQVQDEKARRERQKRLSEILHNARTLWTGLKYDECIRVLVEAQREFPEESEIAKLLETARQDQAEQENQALLTEARNFLRSENFEEALQKLAQVLERSPSDSTAKNLRTLALQGQQQQNRERQFQGELAGLRVLVKEKKYQEVITRGEKLLADFPKEFELAELIAFARGEQAHLQQRLRLEECLEKVNQTLKASRFQEAIQAAEAALIEFPRNMDLMILLDKAKRQREEKEKRELLEKRINEVRNKIKREELTEAIDLARETLVVLGPDTDISQLLRQSEMELSQREKKKREQEEKVLQARTLVDAGNFGDATMILQQAVETRLITDSDPRLKDLLREIDKKKTPPPPAPPPPAPKPPAPTPASGSTSWPVPTRDLGKDYVYQQGPALPVEPRTIEHESATSVFSATTVTGPSVQPIPPPAPPPEEKKKTEKSKKEKRAAKRAAAADEAGATTFGQQAPFEETIIVSSVRVGSQTGTSVREASTSPVQIQVPVAPSLEPASRPLWKQPIAIAGLGVVIVLIVVGVILMSNKSAPPAPLVATVTPPVAVTNPRPGASVAPSPNAAPISKPAPTPAPVIAPKLTPTPTPAPAPVPPIRTPATIPSPAPTPTPAATPEQPKAAPEVAPEPPKPTPAPVPTPTPEPPKPALTATPAPPGRTA